jgi:hypothetical protein
MRPSTLPTLAAAAAAFSTPAQRCATTPAQRCRKLHSTPITNDEWPTFPVFEGADALFPIPFDDARVTYQFTSALHRRLVDAALLDGVPQFFHVVKKGETLEGSIGVVCLILQVTEGDPNDPQFAGMESPPYRVTVKCEGRGVVLDTVSTIPFSTARVQPLLDEKSTKNDIEVQTLENQCFAKARRVAELSAKLEGKGVFADQAAEVLESFMFRIKAFEDLALENFGVWSDEERRERAGFLLLALTTLPRAEEASCLAATDAFERFTILDNFLAKTESELSAKVALDGVFGDAAPRAPLPRSGDRISFFWTEEDGWWDCEVVERVAPGFYSVKWDVDGSITRVQLDDDNANRWRLVPRQRPPEQSERRKRG